MRPELIERAAPTAIALVAVAALGLWVRSYFGAYGVTEREIGATQSRATVARVATGSGTFVRSGAAVANLPGMWPGFRGPNGDGVCPDPTPLARSWPATGPARLWTVALGEGYAAPAVRAGRVYVLDYDQAAQSDTLRCLSLADGGEVWRRSYPVIVKRNHGMSRTIPAVTDRYVVTMGPKCNVMCCDAITGDLKWRADLVADYDATVPEWYAGQCPLIDGNRCILAPGGSALMIAVDLATGKVAWRTPNPHNWLMTHSSIVPVTWQGRRMYVYCASGGVAGVSAKDGAILWETPDWTINTATVPSPVSVGDGRIFLTGGYGAGSMMLQLDDAGGKVGIRTLWRIPSSVFGSEQQTPVLYKDYLYGVRSGGEMVCLDLQGKQRWASGNLRRFALGPYAIADGTIYAMNDTGTLRMIEASPATYHELAEARVLEGPDAWGPLAFAWGRLLARDLTRMVCLDVARH
jgi:outer membrane protein assembly factor BamB